MGFWSKVGYFPDKGRKTGILAQKPRKIPLNPGAGCAYIVNYRHFVYYGKPPRGERGYSGPSTDEVGKRKSQSQAPPRSKELGSGTARYSKCGGENRSKKR